MKDQILSSASHRAWIGISALLFLKYLHSAVFGPLSTIERNDLQAQMIATLSQVAVAMICFRQKVGIHAVVVLLASLILKWFHKLAAKRAAQESVPVPTRRRLGYLLVTLHLCDIAWFHAMSVKIYSIEGPSPLVLALAAEIAVLYGELLAATGRFLLPRNRLFWVFLSIYSAGLKLFVYWALSFLLLSKWYFPVHILRDVYSTIRCAVSYLAGLVSYRQASKHYGLVLAKSHKGLCPICMETMIEETPVETICGHELHLKCLRAWLAKNPTCPICRTVQKPNKPRDDRVPYSTAVEPR